MRRPRPKRSPPSRRARRPAVPAHPRSTPRHVAFAPTADIIELATAARFSGRKIVTEIEPTKTFWPAESYHQNYAKTNTLRYRFYRFSCGRDRRLDEVWGSKARSGAPWSTPAKR